MPPAAFAAWQEQQIGRPVSTAGKTFLGADGGVTAVVCPLPDQYMFLGLASHEILEMAALERAQTVRARQPENAAQSNGAVLVSEYRFERIRREIADGLGWTPSPLDLDPGLVEQTTDVSHFLAGQPPEGWPSQGFWTHWVNVARVWAMVAGRADAGSGPEREALERWEVLDLIDPAGWLEVRSALDHEFQRPPTKGSRLESAAGIFGLVEQLGRNAWAASALWRVTRSPG